MQLSFVFVDVFFEVERKRERERNEDGRIDWLDWLETNVIFLSLRFERRREKSGTPCTMAGYRAVS